MIKKSWVFVLLFCSYHGTSLAAAAKPDWRAEWDRTVAAAEKEGVVSIYIFEAGPLTEESVAGFARAYPKIKVSQLRGRGNDLGPRLVAERRAGKYLADLFAGGKGTAVGTLYVGKLLDPIKPILLLPEVLDETKWWRGAHKIRRSGEQIHLRLHRQRRRSGNQLQFQTGQSARIHLLLGSAAAQVEK
ncbi:MAG: hypothetical protein ACREQO_08035 [Candidatus Binatia bacterium]